jgi:hypothetical protein
MRILWLSASMLLLFVAWTTHASGLQGSGSIISPTSQWNVTLVCIAVAVVAGWQLYRIGKDIRKW